MFKDCKGFRCRFRPFGQSLNDDLGRRGEPVADPDLRQAQRIWSRRYFPVKALEGLFRPFDRACIRLDDLDRVTRPREKEGEPGSCGARTDNHHP